MIRNLEGALRHIQARSFDDFQEKDTIENTGSEPRLVAIWIDAVCINQASDEEKVSRSL